MSTAKSNQWLDATLESVLAAKPIENISLTQPDITAEAAYDLQHQLIARLQTHGGWGDIYGYKAALTAQAAQPTSCPSQSDLRLRFPGRHFITGASARHAPPRILSGRPPSVSFSTRRAEGIGAEPNAPSASRRKRACACWRL